MVLLQIIVFEILNRFVLKDFSPDFFCILHYPSIGHRLRESLTFIISEYKSYNKEILF